MLARGRVEVVLECFAPWWAVCGGCACALGGAESESSLELPLSEKESGKGSLQSSTREGTRGCQGPVTLLLLPPPWIREAASGPTSESWCASRQRQGASGRCVVGERRQAAAACSIPVMRAQSLTAEATMTNTAHPHLVHRAARKHRQHILLLRRRHPQRAPCAPSSLQRLHDDGGKALPPPVPVRVLCKGLAPAVWRKGRHLGGGRRVWGGCGGGKGVRTGLAPALWCGRGYMGAGGGGRGEGVEETRGRR